MKKILTAIVTVLLVLAVFCCAACAEDVTGDWYGEAYGLVMKVTVNADNTYALDAAGTVQTGIWVLEGSNLVMDKGTETEGVFVYDAAAQTLTMDDVVFTHTVIEQWVPAAVREEAAALEDFAGLWNALHVDCFGALLPVEAAEVYMNASIEGTTVSLTITFMDAETFEGEAVLADNVLTLTVPAADAFSKDMTFAASVLEDGSISITTELFSSPATFYLEKVEKLD